MFRPGLLISGDLEKQSQNSKSRVTVGASSWHNPEDGSSFLGVTPFFFCLNANLSLPLPADSSEAFFTSFL